MKFFSKAFQEHHGFDSSGSSWKCLFSSSQNCMKLQLLREGRIRSPNCFKEFLNLKMWWDFNVTNYNLKYVFYGRFRRGVLLLCRYIACIDTTNKQKLIKKNWIAFQLMSEVTSDLNHVDDLTWRMKKLSVYEETLMKNDYHECGCCLFLLLFRLST